MGLRAVRDLMGSEFSSIEARLAVMSQTLRVLSHWLALHSLLLSPRGSPSPCGPCYHNDCTSQG